MVVARKYIDRGEGDTYLREYSNRLKWLDNEVAPLMKMTKGLGFQMAGLLVAISRSMGSVKAVGEWLQSLTISQEYGTTAGQILGVFVEATKKSEWTFTGRRKRKYGRGKNTTEVLSSDIAPFLPNLRKAIQGLAIVVSVLKTTGKVATTLEFRYLKLKLKKIILRLREAKGMNRDISGCTVLHLMTIHEWNPRAMKKTSWARVFCSAKKQSGRVLTIGATAPYFFQGFDL